MANKEFDAKIVLLGNSGVGKTSLVLRYVQGTYSYEQSSTIGASFMTKRLFMEDYKLKLQIWDTAGQERFKSMTPMYYRGSHAAILVYDVTQSDSFESVKDWVKELNTNVRNDIIIAIAGNKVDLETEKAVSYTMAKEYADSIDALLFEVSAKQDKGIEDLFLAISRRLIEGQSKTKPPNSNQSPTSPRSNSTTKMVDISGKPKKKDGCCSV